MSSPIMKPDKLSEHHCVTDEGQQKPLRVCVEKALENYFGYLGGHPAHDLYALVLNEVEPTLLTVTLRHTGGNYSRAAEMLGINRGTLRKKLQHYGIESR